MATTQAILVSDWLISKKSTVKKLLSCLITDQDEMSNFYRGPSIDASYQVSVQLAKQFQGRRFLEIDRNLVESIYGRSSIKNAHFVPIHWQTWPPQAILVSDWLTDQDEMSNFYRGPSIDASYQVSVQLAKQFQGRRFLEIDQSETRIACGATTGNSCF
jgi:hypothetical protein